jgi:hypothetical protein
MTITFACPKCGREIRARDELAGKKGKCNGCQNSIVVPTSAPLVGELIPARPPMLAVEPKRRPPAVPDDELVIAPAPQPAPVPHYQPPNIVVNVTQTAHAHASAVAIAGAAPYSNGWAKAALVLAVLSLLISWIPFISTLAIVGVSLVGLLAVIAFFAALFHGGRGILTTIAALVVGGVATVLIVVSTVVGATAAAVAAKASADAKAQEQAIAAVRAAAAAPAAKASPRDAALASIPEPTGSKPRKPSASSRIASAEPPAEKPVVVEQTQAERDADARQKFAGILRNARSLAKAGVLPGAEKAFRRVIAGAPGTAIAAEAQKDLDGLPPH